MCERFARPRWPFLVQMRSRSRAMSAKTFRSATACEKIGFASDVRRIRRLRTLTRRSGLRFSPVSRRT